MEFVLCWVDTFEPVLSLHKAAEDYLVCKVWVNLNYQINAFQVAIFVFCKQLSLGVYDGRSGCFEVSVNKLIMDLSYRSRHYLIDILVDKVFSIKS